MGRLLQHELLKRGLVFQPLLKVLRTDFLLYIYGVFDKILHSMKRNLPKVENK